MSRYMGNCLGFYERPSTMGAFYIHAYTCVRVYHTCMCIYREIKDTGIYTCTYMYVYHVYLIYLEVQGGYKQV